MFEVILNIPSPYRVHLLDTLWRELTERNMPLHVGFMAKGHKERPKSWLNPKMDFPYAYYCDFGLRAHHFNPGLILRTIFHRSEVLLVGTPFDTFTGIFVSMFGRAKVKCCWVEGQTKTPGKLNGAIGWFKRFILSRYQYVAVPGKDAAGYIALHQGLTKVKMPTPVMLPNLIDETRFRPREKWPKEAICKCREMYKAKESDRVCLIPARLDEVKGLVPFLKALDANLVRNDWRIVIMGQGPLKPEIEALARDKGIADRLVILDYVPYDEMPVCYAAADLMLLPSIHDPNPLSVPEALHSGLPIALSDRAGNVEEAVSENVNGWVLPVKSGALGSKLQVVFTATLPKLCEMGEQSAVNAKFWNSKDAIASFIDQVYKSA